MTHKLTPIDIATDIKRALYASLSPEGFNNKECRYFIDNAIKNFKIIKKSHDKIHVIMAEEKINKPNKDINKRREDLLLASCLLQLAQ